MIIGNKNFDFENNYYIMGILNVTPDSFSDGGLWTDIDAAKAHVAQMIEEGADIIDVGGESTRPGHIQITNEEEIARVCPVIQMIKSEFDVPVSIDSYKAEVVRAALDAGADLVNDIWGLKYDPEMAGLIAERSVPCCLMHNRDNGPINGDFMPAFLADMQECLDLAFAAGIDKSQIILDPGVGFGKTQDQNLAVINELDKLVDMGYPVLLATSRKSVIGAVLDLPTDERVEGTVATTVAGVLKGAKAFRVHDIRENYRAMRMTEAILREKVAK